MFLHIFKYRLVSLLRDRTLIFWTMLFPLVLATFFKLALGNIGESEKFKIIDIGVVNNEAYEENKQFQETMSDLSKGDDAMFNITIIDEESAKRLLLEGDLAGYIFVGDTMKVVVNQAGINQSIIKVFLDQYSQTTSAITTIIMEEPSSLPLVLETMNREEEFTKETSVSKAKPDNIVMYFYSLIAMACLYGSFFGLREIIHIQANLSAQAARMNMAPVHKLKSFLSSSASSLVIQFGEMMILIAYMHFGLGVSFGPKTGLVLLTILLGCIVGIGMGAVIAALVKGGEDMKVGICIGVSMTGSFLAGMMVGDIKYLVDKKAPILAVLNPVNVLTDAFYALYFYDDYDRYILNMAILSVFAVVFCVITYFVLRREKYASI